MHYIKLGPHTGQLNRCGFQWNRLVRQQVSQRFGSSAAFTRKGALVSPVIL